MVTQERKDSHVKSALRPLSDIFAEWPAAVAESLLELINTDFEVLKASLEAKGVDREITDLVYDLRSHGVEIRNSADAEPALANPEVVAKMLGVNLRPPQGRWITYALDASRRRISAPHKTSGSRYLCTITPKVPTPDELTPLPQGGTYLLVRNDTPAVLDIPGVAERIEHLTHSVQLADVVLYDTDPDEPVVYSLRRYLGAQGRTPIALDLDPHVEQKVRSLW